MNLEGKNILLTGATGRIGNQIALDCFALGSNLILVDILPCSDSLNELKSNYPERIKYIKTDITKKENLSSIFRLSEINSMSINTFIHAAYPVSDGWGTRFEDLSIENLYQDITFQLGLSIIFAKEACNVMINNDGGHLIMLSSIQGVSSPKFSHYKDTSMYSPIEYSAIKSGIISMTKWIAKYYKNNNIRSNCISPGGILDNQDPKFVSRYRESCTNIGLLESHNISSMVAFLISNQSYAINGQNIIIDDGWTL